MAIGTTEWLIIGVIVVLLFGATALPKLARSLGRAKGEFLNARAEFERESKATQAAPPGPGEEELRRTARGLGIDDAGKTPDELRRLINEKLA